MSTEKQPEYLSQFCPILSHAVLKPTPVETKQMILPIGGEQQPATPPEAEYIGCQGPTCAFFLRGENRCCIPLLTQAMGVMIHIASGAVIPNPTGPQGGQNH